VFFSYQCRFNGSVTVPSWTKEVAGQILRLDLVALFPPQPKQGGPVIAHDDPGVRTADKRTARMFGF
jgi:hypothetical protein